MNTRVFVKGLHFFLIIAILVALLPPLPANAIPTGSIIPRFPAEPIPPTRPQLTPLQTALAQDALTCDVSPTQFPPANSANYLPIIIKRSGSANSQVAETQEIHLVADQPLPPNPQEIAPVLDRTVATHIYTATRFIYTGDNPIQIEMAATLNPQRVGVLRGTVLNQGGAPLAGVLISILDHPEYGCTFSRADGRFDLVVNGGGQLTVSFRQTGYLPAQRHITVPLLDYVWLDEVALLPYDGQATTIRASSAEAFQVAQGSQVNDKEGTRQATLLFPQGTVASLQLPNGSIQALSGDSFRVRATEYTVGETGDEAMPGQLPAQSGYTYAVDFSVDEAVSAGASRVDFNKPVIFYVENFLNFPVGMAVPTGYYDQVQGKWIASNNGRIIKILAVNSGLAQVDTIGKGAADNGAAIGMTEAERQRLAGLYSPGQSLWRVQISHFTPWDCNWPYGPPPGAKAPNLSTPESDQKPNEEPKQCGSIIGVHSQSLGEIVDLVGTPFRLHYQSDRSLGRNTLRSSKIPLSGSSLPNGLKQIVLDISVAGQHIVETFDTPTPNQSYTFNWNGQDAYGRQLQGRQPMTVRVGYVYDAVYQQPANFQQSFGAFSGVPISGSRARREVTLWQEWDTRIGGWDANVQKLGGWSLDVHHSYDPSSQTLYLGNGQQRSAEGISSMITTVAGNGIQGSSGDGSPATQAKLNEVRGLAIGSDGSIYIADPYSNKVRRVTPDGIITTVAGTGVQGYSGDGGPATVAKLNRPWGIDVGPDGSIYIADNFNHRIRRVAPNGIITTVAGTGIGGFSINTPTGEKNSYSEHGSSLANPDAVTSFDISAAAVGDGGPAIEARLNSPNDVAIGPDGSLYIADVGNRRIRRVDPSGIISTIAGTGSYGHSGDGGPAVAASLRLPWRVAVGPDNSIYVTDEESYRIRRVAPDGIITTVVGNGSPGYSGDGNRATEAGIYVAGVDFGVDDSLYIAGWSHQRVRRVGQDGIINTVAGTGVAGFSGDNGPAKVAQLNRPSDVVFGPDGSLYIAEAYNYRVRKVSPAFANGAIGDILIPSEDGGEVYLFDANGRHRRTLNSLTGATLYEFQYNPAGLLLNVRDGDGNTTTIERDANGNSTAIVGPYGQRTTLSLDTTGYLARVTNAANESYQFGYTADGLLLNLTDPRTNPYRFNYDPLGRLLTDANPAGGEQTLTRTELNDGYEVKHSTILDRDTTYRVQETSTDDRVWTNLLPDGTQSRTIIRLNASRTITQPDGMVVNLQQAGDPRFGMQSPIAQSQSIRTPAGLTFNTTTQRTAVLNNANDPLSLTSLTEAITVNDRPSLTRVYNAADRQVTLTTAQNRQSITTLDAQGRIIQESVPGFDNITYSYDSRGRLATITQGSGATSRPVTFSYNNQGYLSSVTDALGRIANFSYDTAGRVTQETLPGNRVIAYGYDANGNVTSLTPPGRPAHTFNHTAVDLPASYTPPNVSGGGSTQYTYNADQQLTQVTRPDGQTIAYGYDSVGRLQTLTTPTGPFNYTYQPASGNLATITAPDGGGTLSYNYDGSLLTRVAWGGTISGSVGYTYDNNFRITAQTVNGGNSISFQYDNDDLLTGAGSLSLSRHTQNGLLTGSTLGSVTDSWNYNGFGEPISYTARYAGSSVYATQFNYDRLGRILTKTETISNVTTVYSYRYNTAGRLVEVFTNDLTSERYTYDPNGNRQTALGVTSTTYDNQDRLLSYGSNSYSYTANGERLTKINGGQTTSYSYDVLGNLRGITVPTLPNSTQIAYLIDGQNRRIGKRVNGTLVQGFLYAGQLSPAAELDGSGNLVSRFVYANRTNVPDYMIRGGVIYRLITDHLGSVRLVVNSSTGQVVQRLDYDSFGRVLADTNPGFQPFGFAGGLYDPATGLVRFGARDYDAEAGRWTTKDPIGFVGGDTNLYVYVGGNPAKYKDPSGLVCGSDGNDQYVPDSYGLFDFTQACQFHDNCYATVGYSKSECDSRFLQLMTAECMTRTLPVALACEYTALAYYGVVSHSDKADRAFERVNPFLYDRLDKRFQLGGGMCPG